MLILNFKF